MTDPHGEDTTASGLSAERDAERIGPSSGPPEHPRAAALRLVGEFERSHSGVSRVAEIGFGAECIRLRTSAGEDLCFSGPGELAEHLRAVPAGPPGRRPGERREDSGERTRSEQWWELLLDVAGHPSYFEDLHPDLAVVAVQRRPAEVLITVGDGRTTETWSVALGPAHQYPMGVPDDIRYGFGRDVRPSHGIARKIRAG